MGTFCVEMEELGGGGMGYKELKRIVIENADVVERILRENKSFMGEISESLTFQSNKNLSPLA